MTGVQTCALPIFTVKVKGRRLTEYLREHHADLLPRLRLIKVDAEGFDLAVLETLEALITEYRPYLRVEMFSLKRSLPGYRERLLDFLTQHRYEVRKYEGAALGKGTLITRENLAEWNAYDVVCLPH